MKEQSLLELSDDDALAIARIVINMSGEPTDELRPYLIYLGRGIVIYHYLNYTPFDDSPYDTAKSRKIICDVSFHNAIKINDYLRKALNTVDYE